MREFVATLNGVELRLVANFAASVEIAKTVADPLLIAREASVESMLLSRGINYDTKWKFNVQNVPQLIYIGLKAAKSDMKLEAVQELVFEVGFAEARDVALEYLGLIVGPAPEEKLDAGEKDEKK
jgi:hypothetical protein